MLPVTTEGLSKRYGDFYALRDCSLTVSAGEAFGLLGPNGAGKTTLIRSLLGFLRPTSGRAKIGDIDVLADSVGARRHCAYLPGDARLPRHMKSRSLLEFFASIHPLGDFDRALQIAERLELDLRRRVAFMSTGMRQKLALAVVLSPRTPILILDEPTANLDPTVRGEVIKMVSEAKSEGRTVIFSSHVLSEIEESCDAAVFLRRGELAHYQRLNDLRDRHLVRGQCPSGLVALLPTGVERIDSAGALNDAQQNAFVLDVAGPLVPVMQWLLSQNITDLRIEPVRLRTVYDRIHRGQSGDETPGSTGLEDLA